MKNSPDISTLANGVVGVVKRFHTMLFFLLVSGGLFVAILMLLGTISLSSTTATSSTNTINGSFDEETISKLKQPSSGQSTSFGRQSPFSE